MRHTILLVEDSADDVFFMKRAFRVAGVRHPMQVVEDGQKALDYLAGTGCYSDRHSYPMPTLMLLDLRLPFVPGFDVLKWTRQKAHLACVPVVVLTSSREESDMQHAYALGANSFLVKTSDHDELVALVKALAEYWFKYNAVPGHCAEPAAL